MIEDYQILSGTRKIWTIGKIMTNMMIDKEVLINLVLLECKKVWQITSGIRNIFYR